MRDFGASNHAKQFRVFMIKLRGTGEEWAEFFIIIFRKEKRKRHKERRLSTARSRRES